MNCKQHGFSLIEVLVALMILAIVMLSVAVLCEHSIRFTSHMRDHLEARWVAQNALAELQLGLTPLPTESGSQNSNETMDHITWSWTAQISKTDSPHILQVKIAVKKKNDAKFSYDYQGYTAGARQ